MEPSFRAQFGNVNRWFLTTVNQPQFKKVLGEVKLCETMAKFDGRSIIIYYCYKHLKRGEWLGSLAKLFVRCAWPCTKLNGCFYLTKEPSKRNVLVI